MSLKLNTQPSSNTPPLDPGSYPGRVLSIVDLGRQARSPFQGQERAPINMVLFTYELSDEFMSDEAGNEIPGKPRVTSEKFALHPLSSERATSTKRYLALDPAREYGGDLARLVALPTMITLVQNVQKGTGRIFNNVASLSPMRAKDVANCPELVNPSFFFDLDEPNPTIWSLMHDWVKKIVKDNLDYSGSNLQRLLEGEGESSADNPF